MSALRLKYQSCSSNPSQEAQIPAWMLKSQPQGSNRSLKAQIPASRLKSQPQGSNPGLKAQITTSRFKSQPQGSNSSLQAQIPALRLKSQPWSSKLAKHRSSAPLGLLPLLPPDIHINSNGGNGYRWPSNAFATILSNSLTDKPYNLNYFYC